MQTTTTTTTTTPATFTVSDLSRSDLRLLEQALQCFGEALEREFEETESGETVFLAKRILRVGALRRQINAEVLRAWNIAK